MLVLSPETVRAVPVLRSLLPSRGDSPAVAVPRPSAAR